MPWLPIPTLAYCCCILPFPLPILVLLSWLLTCLPRTVFISQHTWQSCHSGGGRLCWFTVRGFLSSTMSLDVKHSLVVDPNPKWPQCQCPAMFFCMCESLNGLICVVAQSSNCMDVILHQFHHASKSRKVIQMKQARGNGYLSLSRFQLFTQGTMGPLVVSVWFWDTTDTTRQMHWGDRSKGSYGRHLVGAFLARLLRNLWD